MYFWSIRYCNCAILIPHIPIESIESLRYLKYYNQVFSSLCRLIFNDRNLRDTRGTKLTLGQANLTPMYRDAILYLVFFVCCYLILYMILMKHLMHTRISVKLVPLSASSVAHILRRLLILKVGWHNNRETWL